MGIRNSKYTDADISEFCESVEKLLESIHVRVRGKKRKKAVNVEEENYTPSDEDMLVMS